MNYFQKIVDAYKEGIFQSIADNDKALAERFLMLMVKEVSSDTRHKASEMTQSLHRDIMNMDMSK